jgi:ABC-type multidrug transport system fused ATPase/permease subunit
VAIVGRTGAGKTSISLGLSRIIDRIEGKLIIEGVDSQNLKL